MARVIVLRFLLVKKKMMSIKTAHALYRDNGPLKIFLRLTELFKPLTFGEIILKLMVEML